MAERSTLTQIAQLGVEVTPGTAVAATRRLQSISITPNAQLEIDRFRPMGQKYMGITSLFKDWTQSTIDGRATYNELVYVLSSVVNTAVITTPGGGTTSRKWLFSSSSTAVDTPITYTVEHGAGGASSNNGRFAYGLVSEFKMTWNRSGAVVVTGAMIGRQYTPNFGTMASATVSDPVPIQPTELSVYLDPTLANVQSNSNTYKLNRVISGEFNLGSRFGPLWVVDQANPGFVAHVETAVDATITLVMEADTQGLGQITGAARTGATQYIRVRGVGAIIDGTITNEFILDVAVKVANIGNFSDQAGTYAIEVVFVLVHSSSWGKAYEISLVNLFTAL